MTTSVREIMNRSVRVGDLSISFRSDLIDRGLSEDEIITIKQAMGEWAGWNIGDADWADEFFHKLDDAVRAAQP